MAGQVAELRRPVSGEQPEKIEILTAKELAERLKLPVTWVQERARSRSADGIPHMRFGKYIRFRWGSPELSAWLVGRESGKRPR